MIHIKFDHKVGYYTINGICLPEKYPDDPYNDELALYAGFGRLANGVVNEGRLRTGFVKIDNFNTQSSGEPRIYTKRYPEGRGIGLCIGDSGGPLIQYVDGGRAVIIGIASIVLRGTDDCFINSTDSFMIFLRVSNYVDWINQTVIDNQ
ncbi:chymotrypsin-like elastase family member 2A [Oppia nitens]|uniref:chymotrypsin-like elastase family member 2A n=1 Tax=Oppia nitens TaxID=1686743 RepID=UPI0023DC852F|nr:chymotrypsin-like elastase family member 2A [Oppia nitens]